MAWHVSHDRKSHKITPCIEDAPETQYQWVPMIPEWCAPSLPSGRPPPRCEGRRSRRRFHSKIPFVRSLAARFPTHSDQYLVSHKIPFFEHWCLWIKLGKSCSGAGAVSWIVSWFRATFKLSTLLLLKCRLAWRLRMWTTRATYEIQLQMFTAYWLFSRWFLQKPSLPHPWKLRTLWYVRHPPMGNFHRKWGALNNMAS